MTLTEARERTPSPTEGIGQWAEKLRAAAFDAVGETDIKEILAKQVEKAKAGDAAAAKFVLQYLTGAAAPVVSEKRIETIKIVDRGSKKSKERTRVVEAESPPPIPVAVDSPAVRQLRRLVGLYLVQNHNCMLSEMERVLEIPAQQLKTVLNCDWFAEKAGRWALSPAGRNAVG